MSDWLGSAIHPARIQSLNLASEQKGRYALYWMQASQRARHNLALEYAIRRANTLALPLVVYFGLTGCYPGANARHYALMLEGLQEVRQALAERGIALLVQRASPPLGAIELARQAACVVVDRGYLRVQREWYRQASARMPCTLIQVEDNVLVPVEVASDKEEYAARTLRPRIERQRLEYLGLAEAAEPRRPSLGIDLESLDVSDPANILQQLDVDRSVSLAPFLCGGERQAERLLQEFVAHKLERYAEERNDPARDATSHLSPYLHFGQISPVWVALQALRAGGAGAEAFLEELIVRRELAINYVFYNPAYDAFEGLPHWAQRTLLEHANDARPYLYTPEELERAETHDPYWNAAQQELLWTGQMHGYMRMYWGKKILEWSPTPQEAQRIALYLNDKYALDGRDANGYTGVAWCLGKHDRPWGTRPIIGNVRSMTASGLRRKFDIDAYVARVGASHRQGEDRA